MFKDRISSRVAAQTLLAGLMEKTILKIKNYFFIILKIKNYFFISQENKNISLRKSSSCTKTTYLVHTTQNYYFFYIAPNKQGFLCIQHQINVLNVL